MLPENWEFQRATGGGDEKNVDQGSGGRGGPSEGLCTMSGHPLQRRQDFI